WRWCLRNPALATTCSLAGIGLLAVIGVSLGFATYQSRAAKELDNALTESETHRLRAQKYATNWALERAFQSKEPNIGTLWLPRARELTTPESGPSQRLIETTLHVGGQLLHPRSPPMGLQFGALAFSLDSRQMLTGHRDRTARLYDVPSGNLLVTFPGHR